MSGYLSHLVNRTLNLSPQVRPVLGTRFAPGPELLTDRAELPPDLRQSVPAAAVRDASATRLPHPHQAAQPAAGKTTDRFPAAESAPALLLLTRDEVQPAPSSPEPLQPQPEPLPLDQNLQIPTRPRTAREPQVTEREAQSLAGTEQDLKQENQFSEPKADTRASVPPVQRPERTAPELTAIAVDESEVAAPAARSASLAASQPQPPAASSAAQAQKAATFLQRVQRTLSDLNAEVSAPAQEPTAQARVELPTQAAVAVQTQAQMQVQAQEKVQAQMQSRGREQDGKSGEPPIIRVHIDHIEVRGPAANVPVLSAAPTAPAPGMSLSLYLEQRRRRS